MERNKMLTSKNMFKKNDSDETNEAHLFATTLVPLRLTSSNGIIYWHNPCPSSTRYCRPINFFYKKETTNTTCKVKNDIDDQIKALAPTEISIDEKVLQVSHQLLFTMLDGKVANAVSNTAGTQRCFLCRLTVKDFNNLDLAMSQPVDDTSLLEMGLSPLHARIKFF